MIQIPIIIAGAGIILIGGAIAFSLLRKKANNKLKNKSVILLGPLMSGKTTIINWLLKGKNTPEYHASGSANREGELCQDGYTISWSDMGGASSFLANEQFELKFTKHDVVLFVFNIDKYTSDSNYQLDVNARLEALKLVSERHPMLKKVIMLIGSHSDCYKKARGISDDNELASVFQSDITHVLKQKDYYHFLQTHPLILANLTDKREVSGILNKLIEELDKLGKNE